MPCVWFVQRVFPMRRAERVLAPSARPLCMSIARSAPSSLPFFPLRCAVPRVLSFLLHAPRKNPTPDVFSSSKLFPRATLLPTSFPVPRLSLPFASSRLRAVHNCQELSPHSCTTYLTCSFLPLNPYIIIHSSKLYTTFLILQIHPKPA